MYRWRHGAFAYLGRWMRILVLAVIGQAAAHAAPEPAKPTAPAPGTSFAPSPGATKPDDMALGLRLEATVALKSPAVGWGGIAIDEVGRRLVLARRAAGVSVLNIDTMKPLGEVADAKGAVAIALAPGIGGPLGRGFSANSEMNGTTISAFDLASFRILATITLDAPASALAYDAGSRRLAALTQGIAGKGAMLVMIDATSLQIVKQLQLEVGTAGGIVADGAGRLFVSLPERDADAPRGLARAAARPRPQRPRTRRV